MENFWKRAFKLRIGLGRSFNLLWIGQTVSSFGSQITIVALPLIAIHELNASNFAVSVLSALTFLPYLLVGLQAGVYVDRADKRKLMLICDALRAVLLLLIPICAFLNTLPLWLLFIVAFANGCCTVFFDVSYLSYLPEIVKSDMLTSGNARLETTRAASQVVGPGMGGFFINVFGASTAVLIDSASYIVSVVVLSFLPKPVLREASEQQRGVFFREVTEGFNFITNHSLLRALLTTYSLSTFFIGLYQAVYIVYMTRTLYLDATSIGLVLGIGNAGFLIGAGISQPVANKFGVGKSIAASLCCIAGGILFNSFALANLAFLWLIVGQSMISLGIPIYNVNVVSLRQAITPRKLLGRVNSVSRVLGRGVVPMGMLLGGAIASWHTPRSAVFIAGVGGMMAVLPALLSPALMHAFSLEEIMNDSN